MKTPTLTLLLLCSAELMARADRNTASGLETRPSFLGRISMTGYFYGEQELLAPGTASLATQGQLLLGDLRLVLEGKNLAGRLSLRADVRVRGTAELDFDQKFQLPAGASLLGSVQPTLAAQGYLGGREYDLRELYLGVRLSQNSQIQFGRFFVTEADVLKLDGASVRFKTGPSWELGLFAGGYPNPFSRSLFSDYEPPCGAGVASGNQVLNLGALDNMVIGAVPATPSGCDRGGPQLAMAGGAAARYQYDRLRLWGSASVVGAFLGGPGDGGRVEADPTILGRVGNLRSASPDPDTPRVYVSWVNQISPSERFSLYSDLLIDLVGSRGAQLTRGAVVGYIRPLGSDKLTIRATYSYMSPLAIGMYLSRAFYNRTPNGTTLNGIGIVENNLSILRTARHEARLNLDGVVFRRLQLYLEGRLRQRSLLDGAQNKLVYQNDSLYTNEERDLAGDATLGIRDNGSVKDLRMNAAYSFLQSFRAVNHLLRFSVGGSFWKSRVGIDVEYVALLTRDLGADDDRCNANLSVGLGQVAERLDATRSLFAAGCFGRRNGTTHEAGVTLSVSGKSLWFLYVDYRLTALLSDPDPRIPESTASAVLGHGVLVRLEFRFAK